MFERYTEDARRAIFFARFEASNFGSTELTAEHLLLGLFRADRPLMNRFLADDCAETIRKQIEQHTPPREWVSTSTDLPLSEECKRVLKNSAQEADQLHHEHIGTEHLLLGLLGEKKSLSAEILRQSGLEYSKARQKLARLRPLAPAPRTPSLVVEEISPARGALRGAGYFRKTKTDWRKFYWEQRGCEPRDALMHRESRRVFLYAGQSFDPAQFELVRGGWAYCPCVICWRDLLETGDRERSEAYTNGQDWLCRRCYEIFVQPERKDARKD